MLLQSNKRHPPKKKQNQQQQQLSKCSQKKFNTTLELDTFNSQDFENYIPQERANFHLKFVAKLALTHNLPIGGSNIHCDENGMVEIATNSGYTIFKNKYRRQIKENMTKNALLYHQNYHTYAIEPFKASPEEKRIEVNIIRSHNKLSTAETKIKFFSIQAKYAWLYPENAGISVENRNICIEVANEVHEKLIDYLHNCIRLLLSGYRVSATARWKNSTWF